MTVQMTNEQFEQLLNRLGGAGVAAGPPAGAAAVMGQLPACQLGRDKLKRYKKYVDWIKDAETKMEFLAITDNKQKINFIRSCAGSVLIEFWEKEARIRFNDVAENVDQGITAQAAHTYVQLQDESRKALLKLVNRDRALIDLMRMHQGERTFIEFLSEVEDQEILCRTEEKPLTSEDLKRMSLLAGMKDKTLAEKAIAEEYDLKQVIQAGINRESSKANVEAMQNKTTAPVNKIEESDHYKGGDIDAKINHLQAELEDVMKIRRNGKYSGRFKGNDDRVKGNGNKRPCRKCTYEHDLASRCPADGRRCNTCGVDGHFSRSPLCSGENQRKARDQKVRFVGDEDELSDDGTNDWEEEETTLSRVQTISRVDTSRAWPGVSPGASGSYTLRAIQSDQRKISDRNTKWVRLTMGGNQVRLFCDTGSKLTIIPPSLYRPTMGKVVAANCHLRSWGSDSLLATMGMFHTTLVTARGARKETWVYVVDGTKPEPLLGDTDAMALGIVPFHPEGRKPTPQEVKGVAQISIPAKLRNAGFKVCTEKPTETPITAKDRQEALNMAGFRPTPPPRYGVPFHYQDRLTTHLQKLKQDGVIEDVDPAEPVDCILNLTISEKKSEGAIRMNIDARPLNVGARHTKYHVPLPQEVRHHLADARVFSEMDMTNGYHQVPLAPESQCIFQSHLGLHRMKRLFFGPKNSTGIFHHEVQKAFAGVPGCITIHDNLLVYGRDVADHNQNLAATLQRAQERGVTLKPSKSTFCEREVKWFGRVFSGAGVSADPAKIENIVAAGRPNSVADVRSLLQAAAYNAKFAFDHQEEESYEEVTAPLRELLVKDARFVWDKERENSFQTLLRMMNDRTILVPFQPGRKTHLVTDGSPFGIAASLYQEDEGGRWLPVDHYSRALSDHEKGWQSQIDWESLAKMWGMLMFRNFLIGTKFTAWGDHQPLVPFYNDLTKPAPLRVTRHRNRILDLTFVDKYLKGAHVPADFNSRHPKPIDHLSVQERQDLLVDDGEEVHIMRVIMADLPPALTLEMLQEAANLDPVYRQLRKAVLERKKAN